MSRRNTSDNSTIEAAGQKHPWAVKIIRDRFSTGLGQICDPAFLDRRYRDFQTRNDPIYAELLRGMNNEPLSKTFVSYWTIAHTLATQSRFWLEDAVADLILHQVRENQREREVEVYSAKTLGAGYFASRKSVAELGERELEHLTARTAWRVRMSSSALSQIDLQVGEQERKVPPERKPFQVRQWTGAQDKAARETDEELRSQTVETLTKGLARSDVTLQCNLLVIDPAKADDTPNVAGFRFINPKTISNHAARKQERVNLLRLYGYLVQEKAFNDPKRIHVCVAELLPRYGDYDLSDRYPDYFSTATYWTYDRLWKFIGVPYEVVPAAIQAVAKDFSKQLIGGLQRLLPGFKDAALSAAVPQKAKQ